MPKKGDTKKRHQPQHGSAALRRQRGLPWLKQYRKQATATAAAAAAAVAAVVVVLLAAAAVRDRRDEALARDGVAVGAPTLPPSPGGSKGKLQQQLR